MDDLLVQGKDRQPSPWPPRLLVIAILVLIAVAVLRHLPPSPRANLPPHPAAAADAGPVQLAGLGSGAAGLLNHAAGIARPAGSPHRRPPATRSRDTDQPIPGSRPLPRP